MRAFVTGGHGFVGPWLVQHLESCGDEVVAPDGVDVTDRTQVSDALAAARPDAVYHLAAQSSVRLSWDDPADTFSVNVLGTVQLLGAVGSVVPEARVLIVSSVEVYGAVAPADLPVGEDAPFAPVNPYAASKAAAELAGLQAHLGRGLQVIRARPFNHTGPGQTTRFFVPDLARQIIEADRSGASEVRAGNLVVKRDFSDVRDVVRAYRLLIEKGSPGGVYNVCSGRSVSLEDVVRRLLALAGTDLPLVMESSRLRPVDVPDLRGDPSRLHEATGWQPAYDLDRTLTDVLDYWRAVADVA